MPRSGKRSGGARQIGGAEREERPRARGVRPIWSGSIAFGLVSVPVYLYPAIRSERVRLRMLAEDGAPLARRYVCPEHESFLEWDEIERGYELEEGSHVPVTDDELDRLAPEKSREIALDRFVPRDEIPPAHLDRAYVLTPQGRATKAYRLLAEAMEASRRAGIATFVMRDKEYLVAVLAEEGVLWAETMRFADEIRPPEAAGVGEPREAPKAAVDRMRRAVRKLAKKDVAWTELRDAHQEELRKLVERKRRAGKDVVEFEEEFDEDAAPVIDLMDVIRRRMRGERAEPDGGGDGGEPTKEELYERAKELGVPGRSKMTRAELARAVARRA